MFPKQVTPFIVIHQHIPTAEVLAAKLVQAAFAPVTGLEWFSEGFTAPAPSLFRRQRRLALESLLRAWQS